MSSPRPAAIPDHLLELPFDHFGRYMLTSELVRGLWREGSEGKKVLDVGGSSSSLKHFLPKASVTLADPKQPPRFTHRPEIPFLYDHYLVAAGGQLPLPDSSFDLVTAHDTLEHVRPEGRSGFLDDLLRLSDRFVVLNGPVATAQSLEAEARLEKFWKRSMAWDEHPLEEHIGYGLPPESMIEDLLRSKGCVFVKVPNGDLMLWTAMFAFKSYLLNLEGSDVLDRAIDRTYNELIYPKDVGGPCYRTAYLVSKDPSDQALLDAVIAPYASLIDAKATMETDVGRLDVFLSGMERHAVALDESAHGQARMKARLTQRQADVDHLKAVLSEREAIIGTLLQDLETARSRAAYRAIDAAWTALKPYVPDGSVRHRLYLRLKSLARWLIARRRRSREAASSRIQTSGPSEDMTYHLPSVDDYKRWIAANEPRPEQLKLQSLAAQGMAYRPFISIIMPTWNTAPRLLEEAIRSVEAQTYPEWELCIADGASDPRTRSVLRSAAERDPRIKVTYLDQNEGISGNSNAALRSAKGEYVAFLDHSDLLSPDALYEVVLRLNRDPSLDCTYSDSDLISDTGERFNPLFTPEWSPELLLSTNYMIQFLVIRRRLVESVGSLRSSFDGAQDWDLLLRVTELTDRIGRIPKILYHWRTDPESSALSLGPKPYAEAAQRAAVSEHLSRRGIAAEVERTSSGYLRVKWPVDPSSKVSIIIPTRGPSEMLERCLKGIRSSEHTNWEVLIADNGGRSEEKVDHYESLGKGIALQVLWWDGPFNYSAVNNWLAARAEGDLLLFLNDDTEPRDPGWLTELVGWAQQSEIGLVGTRLLDPEGSIQHGGVAVGLGGFADNQFRQLQPGDWTILGSTWWYRNVTSVTGACMMIRRDLFEQVGGWDENFELCGSDVELGIRLLRMGYRNLVTPFAEVLHNESSTRGPTVPEHDYFVSYWHYMPYLYKGDPYFNPNLSYLHTRPALRSSDEKRSIDVVSQIIGRQLAPRKGADSRSDSAAFAEWFQTNEDEIRAVAELHAESQGNVPVTTINWLIPDFESPFYGGIHTIFRFADHFMKRYGVKSRFVVLGTGPEGFVRSGLQVSFPDIADSEIYVTGSSDEDLDAIPPADASIASLWTTAYALARLKNTRRKFYLIQDFEPGFYAAGTTYALAEQTYRMNFYGICNTSTLRNIYVEDYGGVAHGFEPCLDTSLFHPDDQARGDGPPYTVFLYGRPGHERNCYEIASAALLRLKERFQDQVRIVTAGSWATSGGQEDYLDHLGLLDYEETADLYRSCHAGLVLSVSKHPSYLPMQLMASGCLVVSNVNPSGRWILRSEENCLLAPPTAESIYRALERGLTDHALRKRLTTQALRDIQMGHSDWTPVMDGIYGFLCDPEGSSA